MKKPAQQKLLGVDFGDSCIGLAFGSEGLTVPLSSISGKNEDTAVASIARLVLENKVTKVVVGLPVHEDGKLTFQAIKTKEFVKRLRIRIKVPVVFVNEFMSTKEALSEATYLGFSKKKRSRVDSLAAELIIRRFYEE